MTPAVDHKQSLAQYDREKLLNEIDILKQMDHENIVKLLEVFEEGDLEK